MDIIKFKKDLELKKLTSEFNECQDKAYDLFCDWYLKGKSNMFVVSGRAGCVDADTEFLTEKGWKKISEYQEGDKVLQYNEDGSANYITPKQYHKYKEEYLTEFKTKYGINQCLSDEHNVVYVSQKGVLYKEPFITVKEKHLKSEFRGRFITSFNIDNKDEINLSENELRLMCAIIADGSLLPRKDPNIKRVRINLKRKDKIERLKMLLENSGKDFIEAQWNPKDLEYRNFVFDTPIFTKVFPNEWYTMSTEQLKIIADEVLRWDGDIDNRNNKSSIGNFFTTVKENADFIQFVFSSLGYKASIQIGDRRGRIRVLNGKEYITKSIDYTVSITKRNLCSIVSDKRESRINTPMEKYKTKDGYKYCFTVDSGMLVLRRGDCVFVTGNSGKSYLLSKLTEVFDKQHIKFSVATFTGKASDVLRKRGVFSQTLHSLLYKPLTIDGRIVGWHKNKELDLKILFVDEFSMLPKEMIDDILDYGIKVCFFGDSFQLPPVSNQNEKEFFADKVDIELTTIVRQAEGSPIIKWANYVREGNFLKVGIREKSEQGIFATLDKKKDKEVIQRLKSEYSQMICGTNATRHFLNLEYKVAKGFRNGVNIGEKLVVLKNNRASGVFNGQIFEVVSIIGDRYKDEIGLDIVELETTEGNIRVCYNTLVNQEFDYSKYMWEKRNLKSEEYVEPVFCNSSASLTCHKLQGSSADSCLIFANDMWFMYYSQQDKEKGKELYLRAVYTAISRSITKCVVII